jgi:hypothetical protein
LISGFFAFPALSALLRRGSDGSGFATGKVAPGKTVFPLHRDTAFSG